jgi:hypothetical protein
MLTHASTHTHTHTHTHSLTHKHTHTHTHTPTVALYVYTPSMQLHPTSGGTLPMLIPTPQYTHTQYTHTHRGVVGVHAVDAVASNIRRHTAHADPDTPVHCRVNDCEVPRAVGLKVRRSVPDNRFHTHGVCEVCRAKSVKNVKNQRYTEIDREEEKTREIKG